MKVFPEKLAKKLPAEFADNINAMETEEIKKRIFEAEGQVYNIENDLDTNEKIISAKNDLKEMTAPYRESKAGEQAKIKFCIFTLDQRGSQIGNGEE